MNEVGEFLICYGGPVLFAAMFAEQLGVPIPATPVLLTAGALVGAGRMNWAVAISAAAIGSLLADFIWFYLGRIRGRRILTWLCRISSDPDACAQRSEKMFSRYGMQGLIVAKFIPCLNALMAPLAAIYNVPPRRFFALDVFGSLVYAGCFILLGCLFGDQLLKIAASLVGSVKACCCWSSAWPWASALTGLGSGAGKRLKDALHPVTKPSVHVKSWP